MRFVTFVSVYEDVYLSRNNEIIPSFFSIMTQIIVY